MNTIEIRYCTKCRWLMRTTWMQQELLTTFQDEITAFTILPDSSGGIFEITVNHQLLWSRKEKGRFPEITELKQMVRDIIAPEKSLGHSDKK